VVSAEVDEVEEVVSGAKVVVVGKKGENSQSPVKGLHWPLEQLLLLSQTVGDSIQIPLPAGSHTDVTHGPDPVPKKKKKNKKKNKKK
jgi:hypothetical protein